MATDIVQIGLTLVIGLVPAALGRADDTSDDKRVEHARAFITALFNQDFKTAGKDFDDTMTKVFSAEKMEQTVKAVTAQAGALKKQGAVRKEKIGKNEAVIVSCEFEKKSFDLRVVYDPDGKITGFFVAAPAAAFKAPVYAKKDSFTEREVEVKTDKWTLPGTLTLPKTDKAAGLLPAVVLVHGSGPNDRDETIGGSKAFRDIAWGLASQGIAVLRYEKRTKAYGAEMAKVKDLTVKEEVLDDVLSAVELLRKTEGIDPKRVFVLGHSLGAMAAPRLGQLDPTIAGLIIMASPTRPIEQVLVEQLDYVLSLQKNLSDEEKAKADKLKKDAARLADPNLSPEDLATGKVLGATYFYWKSMGALQPAETATKVKQPMLILQGERDYQSTMVDFEGWKKAMAQRQNVRLKSYPKLNHMFIAGEGEGMAKPEEYEKPGNVSKEVIDDIADWIKKQS
jgi:dipeptidyl aminopeptidase/acylaminoacyl peptidase